MSMGAILKVEEKHQFCQDGFLLKKTLFSSIEVSRIKASLEQDPLIKKHMFDREDAKGNATISVQWNNPGNSSYGVGARMKKHL